MMACSLSESGRPLHWDPLHYKFLQTYYQSYIGSIKNTPEIVEIITINSICLYIF